MIGLLTPYKISNFGTKLQAYAVQRLISRYDTVEIIDYHPSLTDRLIHKPEYLRSARFVDFKQQSIDVSRQDPLLMADRARAMEAFNDHLHLSKRLNSRRALATHARSYQALVCGSDQIWNPVNLNRHTYMLEFAPPSVRKVAFSPSFGIAELPSALWRTYKKRLACLDYLSVRESSGVRILSNLGFEGVLQTLDPTLLVSSDQWELLEEPPSQLVTYDEPFVFCYFLGNRKAERDIARAFAAEKGFKLVTIPHFKGYVPWDEDFGHMQLRAVTVPNFLWLIHHAAAVCTDSFHGCAFSILFGRELCCCLRHESGDEGATNDRVLTLLLDLGIDDRIALECEQARALACCGVGAADPLCALAQKRAETWAYLDSALGCL